MKVRQRLFKSYSDQLHRSNLFELQNIEQGIMNIEGIEILIKLHNSTFLVRPACNAFGRIENNASMLISTLAIF